jgi:Ran GTPase-activating protein (RanGAP) involved in mRNA processing and transport
MLQGLTHLEDLSLAGVCQAFYTFMPADPRNMASCVDALTSCLKPLSNRLKRLDLSDNALTEFGVDSLLPALVALSTLQHLLLSHNMIKGTEVTLRVMESLRQLRRLDLSDNLLDVQECLKLAEQERPDMLVEC